MDTTWRQRGRAALLPLAILLCGALAFAVGAAPALASSISGQVLDDTNLNHQIDAGDRPLALVEVHLLDPAGTLLAVAVTDSQGHYLFDPVTPGGSYLITTVPPFATVPQLVQPGPGGVPAGVNAIFLRNLQAGRDYPNNNFLQRQFQVVSPVTPETPNTISGQVVNDLNGNGVVDAGELGLGGATLTLVSAAGVVIGTTTSAPTGEFTFAGLANGDYTLTETDPTGYVSTEAIPGVGAAKVDVNTLRVTADAGVTQYSGQRFLDHSTTTSPSPSPGQPAGPNRIEGFVISDTSGNGMFGMGDQPIAGVTVTLKDANGAALASTQTDANGMFEFAGLASGVYVVNETDPPGYQSVDAQAGTGGVKIDENNVRVTIGGGIVSYAGTLFLDRLIGTTPPPGTNQITGGIFNDANGNGVLEAGEGPLANVAVSLRDAANNVIATTQTTVAGTFTFGAVPAGVYSLVETDPVGYVSVLAVAGFGGQVVDANTIRITTVDGVVTYAGNTFLDRQVMTPSPGPNSISGTVVNDLNGNHLVDPGEPPLAGAIVTLQDNTGALVGTTTTGADGSFTFANLADGTYTLVEVDPSGFSSTGALPGIGGQPIDANAIRVTTLPGLTAYPGHTFLDQSGGTTPAGPSIQTVTPSSGGPGSTVTISGRSFNGGALQVMFGTTPATVLNSSGLLGSIVALVPDLPAGTAPITVVNANGTSNAVDYTVTAPGVNAAAAALFSPVFNELSAQQNLGQVAPAMQVVIAQSLGFAQNQAVGGNTTGALNTLRGLVVRIGRSSTDLVTPVAKSALTAAINNLIAAL
jgi:SdrD B-like protein/IPT/TIG domain-containing protein